MKLESNATFWLLLGTIDWTQIYFSCVGYVALCGYKVG